MFESCLSVILSVRGRGVPVQDRSLGPSSVQGLSPLEMPLPTDVFKLVHCEAWAVAKQAVGISLKFLLVDNRIMFSLLGTALL